MMRILITGSRNWTNSGIIRRALTIHIKDPANTTVVHGGAIGADLMAEAAAEYLGCKTEEHLPKDHRDKGKPAPLARNDHMLDSGIDLVLAFMLGVPEKGGTLYTFNGARARRLPVVLYNWPGDPDFK